MEVLKERKFWYEKNTDSRLPTSTTFEMAVQICVKYSDVRFYENSSSRLLVTCGQTVGDVADIGVFWNCVLKIRRKKVTDSCFSYSLWAVPA